MIQLLLLLIESFAHAQYFRYISYLVCYFKMYLNIYSFSFGWPSHVPRYQVFNYGYGLPHHPSTLFSYYPSTLSYASSP